jgi:phage tail-like protein
MAGTATQPNIISAARFVLGVTGGSAAWGFSELAGIAVEIEPSEYIFCDAKGTVVHTKQYGKTKPPTVTLKKPMDDDKTLWGWHLNAQAGSPNARLDCTLAAYGAGSPGITPDASNPVFSWTLLSAWPSKIDLAGMKAGATETPLMTVTFACDLIEPTGITMNATGSIPTS